MPSESAPTARDGKRVSSWSQPHGLGAGFRTVAGSGKETKRTSARNVGGAPTYAELPDLPAINNAEISAASRASWVVTGRKTNSNAFSYVLPDTTDVIVPLNNVNSRSTKMHLRCTAGDV